MANYKKIAAIVFGGALIIVTLLWNDLRNQSEFHVDFEGFTNSLSSDSRYNLFRYSAGDKILLSSGSLGGFADCIRSHNSAIYRKASAKGKVERLDLEIDGVTNIILSVVGNEAYMVTYSNVGTSNEIFSIACQLTLLNERSP